MFGLIAWLQPPSKFTALTKSDSTDITQLAKRGLYVVTTGTVYVLGAKDTGSPILLGTFAAGTFIPGSFSIFGATSSAACVGAS